MRKQTHKEVRKCTKTERLRCARCGQWFIRKVYSTQQVHCPACHKVIRKKQLKEAQDKYYAAKRAEKAALQAILEAMDASASEPAPCPEMHQIWSSKPGTAQPTGLAIDVKRQADPPWVTAYLKQLAREGAGRAQIRREYAGAISPA